MDPIFASVVFGFLTVALVAIVYRLNDVAKAAIKGTDELPEANVGKAKEKKTRE